MKRIRRAPLDLTRKLLFTSALLAAAVLLAEVGVRCTRAPSDLFALTGRTLGPDPKASWADLDAFCAYRARPGRYEGFGARGQALLKTVNKDGYISTPELPLEKPRGGLRVAFLGESSCAGTGTNPVLPDDETWPWRVARRLERELTGRPVDFINGAGSAYTSFESLGRLSARVRFHHPDAVVLYHGWNDLFLLHPEVADLVRSARWRVREDGSWSLTGHYQRIEPHWLDPVLRFSQVATKLRIRLGEGRFAQLREVQDEAHELDLRGLEPLRENLRLFLATCRTLGIEPFVCLQPTLVVEGLPPEERQRCQYLPFPHDLHVSAFAAYRAMLRDEVPPDRLIDLTGLDGRGDLFTDHIHPNAAGTAEIAERVSQALLGWSRSAARRGS